MPVWLMDRTAELVNRLNQNGDKTGITASIDAKGYVKIHFPDDLIPEGVDITVDVLDVRWSDHPERSKE